MLDTFVFSSLVSSTMLVSMTLIYLLVIMSALFEQFVYVDVVMTFTMNRHAFLRNKK